MTDDPQALIAEAREWVNEHGYTTMTETERLVCAAYVLNLADALEVALADTRRPTCEVCGRKMLLIHPSGICTGNARS